MESNKQSKRILITGGAGFIGTNIALEAIKRGHSVMIVDNLFRRGTEYNLEILETMGVPIYRTDVTSPYAVFPADGIDSIIHLAANTGIRLSLDFPEVDFNMNAVGTINMLEVARLNKASFIYASTNKVYGDNVNKIPLNEEDTRYTWNIDGIKETFSTDSDHHTPYGVSKLIGDIYCREYFTSFGVKTVVNRMSCIYGLYQNGAEDQGWIDFFIRSNMFNAGAVNIYGDGKQVRDVLYGGDVARLYVDQVENIDICAGEVFNVGGGSENTLSLNECMRIIEKETDMAFQPRIDDWRPADQKVYISDIKKLDDILGWKPTVSPEEGIAQMVQAYKDGVN